MKRKNWFEWLRYCFIVMLIYFLIPFIIVDLYEETYSIDNFSLYYLSVIAGASVGYLIISITVLLVPTNLKETIFTVFSILITSSIVSVYLDYNTSNIIKHISIVLVASGRLGKYLEERQKNLKNDDQV